MALLEVQTAMKAPQAPTDTVFQYLLNQSQGQPPRPQGLAGLAPQGQPMGDPMQGQPQDQQGLAGIAPQGQPMGNPMQGQQPPPPMDPTQGQQPMMAANGGLMNINLPDDYYDEDSYAHGGIAHFAGGSPGIMDFVGDAATGEAPLRFASKEELGEVANWVKENPAEAGIYGLGALATVGTSEVTIPATILGRLASAIPTLARTVGPKVLNAMKGLVSKQVPGKAIANLVGPVAPRTVPAYGRAAATLYGAGTIGDYFSTPEGFQEAGENLVAPTKGLPALEEQDLSAIPARRGPTEQENLMDQLYAEMGKRYEPSGGSPQAQEPEYNYEEKLEKINKANQAKYGAPSPEKEAYLAELRKQKPLEDTSKQDFYKTTADYFRNLTERSLEGKGLLEAAAGATSVLPESVYKSMENKKAREVKAEADNRSRLLNLYEIGEGDKRDSMALGDRSIREADSAYNRYTSDLDRDTTARNRAEDQKREDFYNTQANNLEMIKLKLAQAKGEAPTNLQEKINFLRTDPELYKQMFGVNSTLSPKDRITVLSTLANNAPSEEAAAGYTKLLEAELNGGGQEYKEGETGVTGDGRSAIYKNGRWEFSS
jgi:hypothetical protein